MKAYIFCLLILLASSLLGNGQSINDYLEIAAENNPGLKSSYKDFEVALQKIPQVSSLPDPIFSFGYFISPVETRVGPQRAKFSLLQMFPWFGTLGAQEDAASKYAESKFQAFLSARDRLFLQVSSSYYPLFELGQWEEIEKENIEILESYKSIATKKFENGTGGLVDVLRVDLNLEEAKTNLEIIQKRRKPLIIRFNKILNRDEQENIEIPQSLDATIDRLYDSKDSLIANPLIQELEFKVQASKAAERAAKKRGLPKLGFGLDYVFVDEIPDINIPENGKNTFMPMVSVTLPIFRAKYKSAIVEAQLNQEKFSFQKEETTNTLFSEFELAWFEFEKQRDLIDLFKKQIAESEQTLNLLFVSYGNSGKDFEEVLRMQQQLLKYEKLKATALSEYHISLARLDFITSNNPK